MALKQRSATGKYLRIKDGKFYLSTDKQFENSFAELEGTLVDIYFKDETYEGTPQRKLYLVMNDGDENYILGLNFESLYASTFLQFLPNVDLSKPFTLSPSSKDEVVNGVTKTKNVLFISQNGVSIKKYFTKDNPNGLPEMKKVRVSGKDVWDKTDFLNFFEDFVENKIKPQLSKSAAPTKNTVIKDADNEDGDPDDLPWEND